MQKIVIIGDSSYLAQGIEKFFSTDDVVKLSYHDWQKNIELLQRADYILNFAIHPYFMKREMDDEEILDIKIAKAIKNTKAKFVFMSSRKVYGTTKNCIIHKECDDLKGFDFYSINKIKIEKALQKILGNRTVILRISNVLGEPVSRIGYKTFIGWICENYLQKGKLNVNQNIEAEKDFITKDFLHQSISAIVHKNLTGIYNISSGFGTSIKKVLTGYVGTKNLVLLPHNEERKDQFILDNSKLIEATGLSISMIDMDNYLSGCNKRLDKYKHAHDQFKKFRYSKLSRNYAKFLRKFNVKGVKNGR